MRLNILAFAAGVIVLQMQPELPPAWLWALAGGLLALPAMRWQRAWPGRLLGVLACLALGFAWAAWRADIRLADALGAGVGRARRRGDRRRRDAAAGFQPGQPFRICR